MLTLYVVLGLLGVELVVLTLLLLPYVNRVTAPVIERLLIALRLPLRITLGIITFLFYEAFAEMRRHQDVVNRFKNNTDHISQLEAFRVKFRSERNFYLFALTFILFVVILRLDVILNNYQISKARVLELEAQLAVPSEARNKKKD